MSITKFAKIKFLSKLLQQAYTPSGGKGAQERILKSQLHTSARSANRIYNVFFSRYRSLHKECDTKLLFHFLSYKQVLQQKCHRAATQAIKRSTRFLTVFV